MSATLTITHTEQIKLNGSQQGASTTQTINAITEVYKRNIAIPTSEVTLLSFGATVSAGTFVESDVMYIRITNLDASNHIYLVCKNEYNNEVCMKLDKGQTFIYNPDLTSGVIDTMLANQVALGFAEGTGDCATGSDDVTGITANGAIIPGLRVSSAAIATGATVGAITGTNGGVSQATAHTMVTRDGTTGAETVSNATGNEDNDSTYAAGFGDLVEITAEADDTECMVEVFVASK
jgi:hypothetical protein